MNNLDDSVQKVLCFLEDIPCDFTDITQRTPYYNMAATITDSVLQAGMNYKSVVYPRISNILKRYAEYCTTCDFIILFQTIPIEEIIQWKNKRKQETICQLAWLLYEAGVNNENDLAGWLKQDINVKKVLEIKGIGLKTVDYLKLLSGEQAIPIDRHMYHFLELADVLVRDYQDASIILRRVAYLLGIGESVLDKIIWNYMSQNKGDKQFDMFDLYSNLV